MKKKIENIIYKYLEESLPVDILVKKPYPDLKDDRTLETFLGEEITKEILELVKKERIKAYQKAIKLFWNLKDEQMTGNVVILELTGLCLREKGEK